MQIVPLRTGPGGSVEVNVDIRNSGAREGEEVVQLYINDTVSSVTRPLEELKGFEKVSLKAGESKTAHFTLHTRGIVVSETVIWNVS